MASSLMASYAPNRASTRAGRLYTDTLSSANTGTISSQDNPVVVYASEGLTLSGTFTGTGVLIVDGHLLEQGNAAWTGLVVVRSVGGEAPSFTMRGTAAVLGGVLLYSEGAAHLEIRGNAEVRYSRAVFAWLREALFATL